MSEPVDLRSLLVASHTRRLEHGEPPHRDPTLTRVRRGFFRPLDAQLTASDEHRLRIYATAAARGDDLVFTHASAAELWGCPQMASATGLVHITQPGRARRTTAGVAVHRGALPAAEIVTLPSGLKVSSLAWTAVLVAATQPLPDVLLPLDALLHRLIATHRLDAAVVIDRLIAMIPPRMKGGVRAERHLRLADPRSGSAGESLSRGQMILLRVPMPQLQTPLPRADGSGHDIVDFDWPQLKTFGEFDGEGKYFDPRLTDGRTPSQVLRDEKLREDRVRRHRPHGVRWGWNDALSRDRLGRILAAGGILPQS